ncbi:hypothetical protein BACCIP111895_01963 [Neobacillus rhizosphaerae]|uniref:Protein NO VEIN C-terminal domain-containing protein n=1 Tax=Neobacillus rhizosphaerae TaxID=2880965 RepID=A0ABM9EQ76_9BACI|nr:DUF3883 domain-containing protein [Neobacillus rhizosphaerae]CAH2714787.1 hypothetical protein BACCIP111895_01963 [Neobacillus rhizosphaerae]
MDLNRKKGLIVSYYLSKYDRKALKELKYDSFRAAFRDIGAKLDIPPNTIKNRRDDYDSLNDNNRSGWYQKELSKSTLDVVEKFGNISEDALTEIVKDILFSSNEISSISEILQTYGDTSSDRSYNNRGITGKRAEKLFIKYFNDGFFDAYQGELIDTRDDGCGYDFKLSGESAIVFEIKGLSSEVGGVSFTDKEWSVAKELKTKYILIIISNVFNNPRIKLIVNPYEKINPTKRLTKVISVNWTFQTKELW